MANTARGGMRRKIVLWLQIGISLGLLAWLFSREDLQNQFWQVILNAHAGWLLAGLLVAGIGNALGIVRWGMILKC